MSALVENWKRVRAEIDEAASRTGRSPGDVHLIAVSKTHPFLDIEKLYAEGQRDFGENYVQELVEKAEAARAAGLNEIRWHFIGNLQTNKVKVLLPHLHLLHTLDRPSLLTELAKRAAPENPVRALIEVNIDSEATKGGVPPAQIDEFVGMLEDFRKSVKFEGWMAIPEGGDLVRTRAAFDRLAEIAKKYAERVGGTLSMGMSADYVEAIGAGATFIRVGTAIFGSR